ncbi:MAG: threonine synthase [Ignavibacteria bacterium]|nr:threonine synthase [Ignavibacteria bacterium]
MKYYSDKNRNLFTDFKTAVLEGLAPDGGLFVPDNIPVLSQSFFDNLHNLSIGEIAFEVLKPYVSENMSNDVLNSIISRTFTFPAPVIKLSDSLGILELFHGPTLAFKDFGARFMANTMSQFIRQENRELNILVATSGDTGSAVAHGFYGVEGINVYILYPSQKVSKIQEMQLTTLDKNITALEIEGTFDDCQKLVKEAFTDKDLRKNLPLSSANSINIARLLPQSIYYFEAFKQVQRNNNIIFSVPSGNLGNLTAGLIAKKSGLPVKKFIAAANSNNVFTEYINSGQFIPRPSVKTYSNAMDVGNPSNLARIDSIYRKILGSIREDIYSISFSDFETIEGIKELKEKYDYLIDPHGAIGYLAFDKYEKDTDDFGIILETAHPAKFGDVIELNTGFKIEMPKRLSDYLKAEKKSIKMDKQYDSLKSFLRSKKK